MTAGSDDVVPFESVEESPPRDGNGAALAALKKGPWTSAEDAVLSEYVARHGEGNWNAVQRHTGLARCGKSCRLRWTNHLRPDLKKGAFSPQEERRIIEMHAAMGNKWARMATKLPGRTDNEIKNFWNTRIKRQERAGLPIYPPDIMTNRGANDDRSSAGVLHDAVSGGGDLMHVVAKPDIPTIDFKIPPRISSCTRVTFPQCNLPIEVVHGGGIFEPLDPPAEPMYPPQHLFVPPQHLFVTPENLCLQPEHFCVQPESAAGTVESSLDADTSESGAVDDSWLMDQAFGYLPHRDHRRIAELPPHFDSLDSVVAALSASFPSPPPPAPTLHVNDAVVVGFGGNEPWNHSAGDQNMFDDLLRDCDEENEWVNNLLYSESPTMISDGEEERQQNQALYGPPPGCMDGLPKSVRSKYTYQENRCFFRRKVDGL